MTVPAWRICTNADDLEEGLFGQVVLWTFEVLPYLAQRGILPAWAVRSRLYGEPPDWRILPGVFDLAYDEPTQGTRDVSMLALRVKAVSVLGGDWAALHRLWHAYFRVPARIVARADAVALPPGTLGLHYRGTDKNLALRETNPVDIEDFLLLAEEFLSERPEWHTVFMATDDHAVVTRARQRLVGKTIINLGEVSFHKGPTIDGDRADRALLDCLLLSRCAAVLKCSSALSGFAKVLNPALDCYRVSACKMFGDVPYFPDAHVPRLQSRSAVGQQILARQFQGDWLDDERVPSRFRAPFVSLPRHTRWQVALNWLKYRVSLVLGRPRKA